MGIYKMSFPNKVSRDEGVEITEKRARETWGDDTVIVKSIITQDANEIEKGWYTVQTEILRKGN